MVLDVISAATQSQATYNKLRQIVNSPDPCGSTIMSPCLGGLGSPLSSKRLEEGGSMMSLKTMLSGL